MEYSKSTEMSSRKSNVYRKREKWVSQNCFEMKKVTEGVYHQEFIDT